MSESMGRDEWWDYHRDSFDRVGFPIYQVEGIAKQAYDAATAAERERWEPCLPVLKDHINEYGICPVCKGLNVVIGSEIGHYENCVFFRGLTEANGDG